jgi:hypothetical protein
MSATPNTRYQGKPLLRILECYVLDAIGLLEDSQRTTLEQMTPKLREIYKTPGSWKEIVEKIMELPPNMPAMIQDLWKKNTAKAQAHGQTLQPQAFAEMFVDANLA